MSQLATQSFAEFGSAKLSHLRESEFTLPTATPVGILLRRYGQDATANIDKSADIVHGRSNILGADEFAHVCCDGHGGLGAFWSALVAQTLLVNIHTYWHDMKRIMRRTSRPLEHRQEELTLFLKNLFRETETTVSTVLHPETQSGVLSPYASGGGTTATLQFVMIVGRRRYVIAASVGDSPAVLHRFETETTLQMTTEGCCDNARAISEFGQRYLDAGIPVEQWPTPIYNRINRPGHHQLQTVREPLRAWRFRIEDDKVTAEPDLDSYEILVSEGHGMGTQALQCSEMEQRPDGNWAVVDSSLAAHNFGNTIRESDLQATTGFGDLRHGFLCDCDASVCIEECPEAALVTTYSDGIGDLFTPEQWVQKFGKGRLLPNLDSFRSRFDAEVNDPWKFFQWSTNGLDDSCLLPEKVLPKWDDISAVMLRLPAWQKSRKRHAKHRV